MAIKCFIIFYHLLYYFVFLVKLRNELKLKWFQINRLLLHSLILFNHLVNLTSLQISRIQYLSLYFLFNANRFRPKNRNSTKRVLCWFQKVALGPSWSWFAFISRPITTFKVDVASLLLYIWVSNCILLHFSLWWLPIKVKIVGT